MSQRYSINRNVNINQTGGFTPVIIGNVIDVLKIGSTLERYVYDVEVIDARNNIVVFWISFSNSNQTGRIFWNGSGVVSEDLYEYKTSFDMENIKELAREKLRREKGI